MSISACVRTRSARRSIATSADGRKPLAVVATIGTTSTTSVDPVAAIAEICAAHGVWLHVDAAYAGVAAMLPDHRAAFEGWQRADSIVVNPHKWLFVPVDLSAFYCRRMDVRARGILARAGVPADTPTRRAARAI